MNWTYAEAFKRNLGLVSPEEQEKLRNCRVAILGMGGVGGIEAITLARLGIGKFNIADPDTFEVANFNRQYGADITSLNQSKVEVMAKKIKEINPDADIHLFKDPIGPENSENFLKDADLFVDGVDAFQIDVRRLVHNLAYKKGLYTITAGPLGASVAWNVITPKGMTFDEYYDIKDSHSKIEKLAAFFAGLAPRATHIGYMDLNYVNPQSGSAPSLGLACQLCGGVVGGLALKILLNRGRIKAAPTYHQFDIYKETYKSGRLFFGNKGPLQRIKRFVLEQKLHKKFQSSPE